jgi:hypothetical protein
LTGQASIKKTCAHTCPVLQNRLPGDLAMELEGIAAEYEADLMYNQQVRLAMPFPSQNPQQNSFVLLSRSSKISQTVI